MGAVWNFTTDQFGRTTTVTSETAIANYEKWLLDQTMQNLEAVKKAINLVTISSLNHEANFYDYLRSFTGVVVKDSINGFDLEKLVQELATERATTEPCFCTMRLDGDTYYLTNTFDPELGDLPVLFNGTLETRDNYEIDYFSEKGENVYGEWSHPSITAIYEDLDIDNEPEEYDWKLRMTRKERGECRCEAMEFDKVKCEGCQYAKYAADRMVTTYVYIK